MFDDVRLIYKHADHCHVGTRWHEHSESILADAHWNDHLSNQKKKVMSQEVYLGHIWDSGH